MKAEDSIRLFGLNNLAVESDLRRIQATHKIDFGHETSSSTEPDEKFYPQFSQKLRDEAALMARHFAIFYCLENFMRELILWSGSESFTERLGGTLQSLRMYETMQPRIERRKRSLVLRFDPIK